LYRIRFKINKCFINYHYKQVAKQPVDSLKELDVFREIAEKFFWKQPILLLTLQEEKLK
jgi:hypothetical protein